MDIERRVPWRVMCYSSAVLWELDIGRAQWLRTVHHLSLACVLFTVLPFLCSRYVRRFLWYNTSWRPYITARLLDQTVSSLLQAWTYLATNAYPCWLASTRNSTSSNQLAYSANSRIGVWHYLHIPGSRAALHLTLRYLHSHRRCLSRMDYYSSTHFRMAHVRWLWRDRG